MAINFKRALSPFLQSFFAERATLNSRAYNTEIAMEMVLKDGTPLNYATKALTIDSLSQGGATINVAPISFVARIAGVPDIRHSQSKAPDAGEIEIVNLDYIISSAIPSATRVFDNVTCTVYLCFPKANGNYEALIYFVGLISAPSGDDESARFSLLSDMSAKIGLIGKEMTQRCLNELGDTWCGVPVGTLPAGATCSKIYHDTGSGCAYWGGVFNGVPFLSPTGLAPSYGGENTGGDFETAYPRTGCPDIASWFRRADTREWIQGFDLTRGLPILDHKNRVVTVEAAEPFDAPYRYRVSSIVGASLIVSASHHFLIGENDEKGRIAHEWRFDEYGLVAVIPTGNRILKPYERNKQRDYRFDIASAGTCLRLSTTAPNTYIAGEKAGYALANHNLKPLYSAVLSDF